jgi:uncharacterized protein YcgI (DUF1989 family)
VSTVAGTATTNGARDHARAQGGTVVETMPTLPAGDYPGAPPGATWAEVVAPGGTTSKVLARGTHLRLRDLAGSACAQLMLFNADQPWERLNVADTVKIPWQAYLGEGHPLLSDQGRILATIVGDDSGRHDALCCGGAGFVTVAAKHDLTPRDLPPCVAFFRGVRVQADGALTTIGSAGPDASVTLRCELPVIALIANIGHPLEDIAPTPLEVLAWRGEPTSPDDPLWSATPELERAFLNTADYVEARA